ncbi:MAG: hypothetical protein RBT65_16815 [Methanolobus sp.]|nr:hypothetical protein [Methanolobus sp.]
MAKKKTEIETKTYIAKADFLAEAGQVRKKQEVQMSDEEASIAIKLKLVGEKDGVYSK